MRVGIWCTEANDIHIWTRCPCRTQVTTSVNSQSSAIAAWTMGLTGQPLPALALIHLLSCCRNPFLNTWGSPAASCKGEKLPSSGGGQQSDQRGL